MATIKVTLDKRSDHTHSDGRHPVVLRIGHKSKTRDIGFDIYAFEDQFDPETRAVTGITNAVRHSKKINKVFTEVDLWLSDNKADVKLWSIARLKDTIEKRFFKKQPELGLLDHAAKLLYRMHIETRYSTVSSYEDSLKIWVKYQMKLKRQSDTVIIKTLFDKTVADCFEPLDSYRPYDMPIKGFSVEYAKDFKAYLSQRFKSKNTVGIYLRSLQAILNDAESSHTDLKGHKPLEGIKKSSTSNALVVLSQEEIAKIREAELESGTAAFKVRHYFLFMFSNMGMNFYDLVLLKKHQFDGERLNYTRQKTANSAEDFFSIKQSDECRHIIAHYGWGKKPDEYIFPILPQDTPEERVHIIKNYRAKWFNKHFLRLCKDLGITKHVTTYTARDTWTNLGLEMGIDIRKISSGLGHASVKTTEKHYSGSIQAKLLDEINERITYNKLINPE